MSGIYMTLFFLVVSIGMEIRRHLLDLNKIKGRERIADG
jgi:hypothetical protein